MFLIVLGGFLRVPLSAKIEIYDQDSYRVGKLRVTKIFGSEIRTLNNHYAQFQIKNGGRIQHKRTVFTLRQH